MAEIQIYGKLHNNTTDGVIAGAEQVYDGTQGLTQGEINAKAMAKADLASPEFTGTPKAPTAAEGTSTEQVATTAFVQQAVAGIATGPLTEGEIDAALAAVVALVKVGSAGLATFCPERALDFSGVRQVEPYAATGYSRADGKVDTELTRVETVAAGEGVLLRSMSGGAAEAYVPVAAGAVAPTEGNMFVGTPEEIGSLPSEDETWDYFILNSNGPNGPGFYLANDKTVGAGKAYLRVANMKPVSVKISSAGASTLYSPKALDFAGVEGLTAYIAKLRDGETWLSPVSDVPAYTGVVLMGAEGEYEIPAIESSDTDVSENKLIGFLEETRLASNDTVTYYGFRILKSTGNLGFAKISEAGMNCPAGKAYLALPTDRGGDGAE